MRDISNIWSLKVSPSLSCYLGSNHSNLKIWEYSEIYITNDKIQRQYKNSGTKCIFTGYSIDHSKDVIQRLNLQSTKFYYFERRSWMKIEKVYLDKSKRAKKTMMIKTRVFWRIIRLRKWMRNSMRGGSQEIKFSFN